MLYDSLTRDFGHFILGSRPGRGRLFGVSRKLVIRHPITMQVVTHVVASPE
jgi:hypothetical protein